MRLLIFYITEQTLRSQIAHTNSEVVERADAGDSFTVLEKINDWYKIE